MLRRWTGKDADWHRLLVSFWSSVGFVGLGASALVFGPTLLDLGASIGVGVAVMSAMFGARASGGAIGSVSLGYVMDRWARYSYTILTLVLSCCIASTVVIPLSGNVYTLAFLMLFNGAALGAIDSATHALLMRLWKDNSGPCMQVLHFAYAFGAFIAPLIAKHFISDDISDMPGDIPDTPTYFTKAAPTSVITSNITMPDEVHSGNFKIAYWISAATFLPTLIAYVYFAAKFDFVVVKDTKSAVTDLPDVEDGGVVGNGEVKEIEMKSLSVEPADNSKEVNDSNSEGESSEKEELIFEKSSRKKKVAAENIEKVILSTKATQLTRYKYTILLLLSTFMFVYVGLEVAYGSLIFTAVVLGVLDFTKQQATLIQSLFWGTFAFGRLFSIVLVFLKVRSSVMICMNLTGSLVAALIMISFAHSSPAIWLASTVLGASYSSIYPTAMTWMSENLEATGLATAILITGGVLGDITLPAIIGALIASVSPDMLFYLTFVGVIISGAIAAPMFWIAHRKKRFECERSPSKSKIFEVSDNCTTREEKLKLMEEREHSEEEEETGDM